MTPRRLTLLLLVIAALLPAGASAQPVTADLAPFEVRTDPISQIASYYNAINLNDFIRAYSYWDTPPNDRSFDQFVAGFRETARVATFFAAPVIEDFGAGNGYARVPTLLAAEHTDGTRRNFVACFTVRKLNVPEDNAAGADPNWRLTDAEVTEVDGFDLANLEGACEPLFDDFDAPYTLYNSPVQVLASFVDAIGRGDSLAAERAMYAPPDPTLSAFASGFDAAAADLSVVVRGELLVEGTAGNTFANIPALVMVESIDGNRQYYEGCFVARHSPVPVGVAAPLTPEWQLFTAGITVLNSVDDLQDGQALLDGVCPLQAAG